MAIFVPRTFQEIMQDMLARLISATPVNDVNFGSVWTTLLEAAAQEDDEQYFQMSEIIKGYSIDSTYGTELDSRAFEYNLERIDAGKASATVTFGDEAITKIETDIYSGLNGAPAGTFSINGNSATGFSVAGSIIIGRDTPNEEIVPYSSIDQLTNYVRFNLSSGLAKDHGTDEIIVLSQGGNRLISAGTIVKVLATDRLNQALFETDADATIKDGESEVTGVAVTCTETGTIGNVPVGAIANFDSKPFSTATVRNPSRVTNGRDEESDQELRDRIKDYIQGTDQLTFKTKYLVICSSLKDVMAFMRLSYPDAEAVAPDSENTLIPAHVISAYKLKYKNICTLFDNDEAGIRAMDKYGQKFNLSGAILPMSKDLSDSIRDHGILKIKEVLTPILKRALK